jgi:probable aminopeptidase NPEPL1
MSHTLLVVDRLEALQEDTSLHVIGRRHRLEAATDLLPGPVAAVWPEMLKGDPGDHGRTASTFLADGPTRRVTLGMLPDVCSRHNSPARTWAYPRLLAQGRGTRAGIVVLLDDASHARAAVAAVARCLPTFTARSQVTPSTTHVLLLAPEGPVTDSDLQLLAEGVQRAAHLVDMPPDQLGPDAFVARARSVAQRTDVSIHVLRGAQLASQGFGGLVGVGKAATQSPALVVLDWAPEGASRSMVWVGKGITYDTGGLSLKTKTGMPGMKTDMGGAAAVLAAFETVVRMRLHRRITAVLCIAENAIGPDALRPDDVITMYSGRTVEVNNTDAEGRLVLADGVAWAVRHRAPKTLIDLATLTGAQATATGKLHAALYCNHEPLERAALEIGRQSGDLTHALPYAPELFRKEFASGVADMRNSVKDRGNAQSSCAGQFVANHLGRYDGPWLHVDMAAPSHVGHRGTGYGVALLVGLARHG